jgi:hypothetical protein
MAELKNLIIAASESTTSLTFLVDGISCVSPFEKEVVDARDSLMNYVICEKEKKEYEARMEMAGKMCVNVARGCGHILEMGEKGEKYLIGLSPSGVVLCPDGLFVIVYHIHLVQSGMRKGAPRICALELRQWKAPEIIKGDEKKETEKSCVFTIGMICYSLVVFNRPFGSDSDEIAIGRLVMGEKPNVCEMEEKKCPFLPLIKECWCDSADDRPTLNEVKRKAEGLGYGEEDLFGGCDDDDDKKEEEAEEEEDDDEDKGDDKKSDEKKKKDEKDEKDEKDKDMDNCGNKDEGED